MSGRRETMGHPGFGPTGYQPDQPRQPQMSHTMPMSYLPDPRSAPPSGVGPTHPKSPWTAVLAGTTALFLVVSLVLAGFLVSTTGRLDKANRTIAERDSTISGNEKQLKALRDDLEAANEDLKRTEGENDDLADDKDTIAKCLKLLFEALDAAGRNDQATAQRKATELQVPCRTAQRLIS